MTVPPRSGATPSRTAETAPTQRDCHLQLITEKDWMGWRKASGCNKRARAEASIGRFKRMIGDGLRSRTDGASGEWSGRRRSCPEPYAGAGTPNDVRVA